MLSTASFNFNLRRYNLDFDAERQGLTLVHISAQLEPCLSLKPAKHPNTWDKKCSR
jgi:hypothetical protein